MASQLNQFETLGDSELKSLIKSSLYISDKKILEFNKEYALVSLRLSLPYSVMFKLDRLLEAEKNYCLKILEERTIRSIIRLKIHNTITNWLEGKMIGPKPFSDEKFWNLIIGKELRYGPQQKNMLDEPVVMW